MAVWKGEYTGTRKKALPVRGVLLELEFLLESLLEFTEEQLKEGLGEDPLCYRLSWILRAVEDTMIELRKTWSNVCVSGLANKTETKLSCVNDAQKALLRARGNARKFSEFLAMETTWPDQD